MMDFLIQKAYAQLSGPDKGGFGLSGPDSASNITAIDTLLDKILDNIVNPLILLLMAVAVIYFLWGLFDFIKKADSPEDRNTGYQHMLWGVIGIFIMISAIGLKNLIGATLGL